jgi:hypothetical protein
VAGSGAGDGGVRPRLLRSSMTDRVYIVTSYRDLGDNKFIARTKYEVLESDLSAVFLVSIPEEDRDKDEFELVVRRATATRSAQEGST